MGHRQNVKKDFGGVASESCHPKKGALTLGAKNIENFFYLEC
jgi:hypothetical protein